MKTSFGRIVFGLLLISGAALADGPLSAPGVACEFLKPVRVIEFDEQTSCTAGKPKNRFICLGTARCTREGYAPQIISVVCEMPEDGCGTVDAKECGKAKTTGFFSVRAMEDINLNDARHYKRTIQDDEKLTRRSNGANVTNAGINH